MCGLLYFLQCTSGPCIFFHFFSRLPSSLVSPSQPRHFFFCVGVMEPTFTYPQAVFAGISPQPHSGLHCLLVPERFHSCFDAWPIYFITQIICAEMGQNKLALLTRICCLSVLWWALIVSNPFVMLINLLHSIYYL